MLNILGPTYRTCDGLSRRSFLKAGFLGLAGLSLADHLRLETAARELLHLRPPGGVSVGVDGNDQPAGDPEQTDDQDGHGGHYLQKRQSPWR